jgi:acylphosphatase
VIAKRCFVSGRVQGVFYRATTREKAQSLGLRGFARNLADGRVEVLAIGEAAAVTALTEWLWVGSATSEVKAVEVREVEIAVLGELPAGFAGR